MWAFQPYRYHEKMEMNLFSSTCGNSSHPVYHEKMRMNLFSSTCGHSLQVMHSLVAQHLHSTLKVQGSTLLKTSSPEKSNPTQPNPIQNPQVTRIKIRQKVAELGAGGHSNANVIEAEFLHDETNTVCSLLSWFALIYSVSRADHWGYFPL